MFVEYLNKFQDILSKTVASSSEGSIVLDDAFQEVIGKLKDIRSEERHVYLVGNGGSSGIVSHGAIDFLNACGFKAHALTDNSLLTCMANDYGYENVFSQPLKTLFSEGDALVAISSSGTSKNIVNACEEVKDKAGLIVTFSGFGDDNPLRKNGDYNFWLDSRNYGYVEIGHALLLHYVTDHLNSKD